VNYPLKKNIKFYNHLDDQDFPIINVNGYNGSNGEFTECNCNELREALRKMKRCKSILEIGVDRNNISSTKTLLSLKDKDCVYIGIDIRDCSYLNDPENNSFFMQERSENIETVKNFINSKGISELDFIFIDGWHSINQVLKEWEYTSMLSQNGIVGFHDTNNHPGPTLFVDNLNNDWIVEKKCFHDWGISFVKKAL